MCHVIDGCPEGASDMIRVAAAIRSHMGPKRLDIVGIPSYLYDPWNWQV